MERTQILMEKDLKKKIKYRAKLEGKSMANVIRDAVNDYVKEDKNLTTKEAFIRMAENAVTSKKDHLPGIDSSNFRDHLADILTGNGNLR